MTATVALQVTNRSTGTTFPVKFLGEDAARRAVDYILRKGAQRTASGALHFTFTVVSEPVPGEIWEDVNGIEQQRADAAMEAHIAATYDECGRRFDY